MPPVIPGQPVLAAAFTIDPSDMLLVAGILLVIVALMMRLRRRRREIAQTPSSRQRFDQLRQKSTGSRNRLDDTMVQIQDLSRQMGAHLDAKAIRMEQLIERADERIARLESMGLRVADDDKPGAPGPAAEPAPGATGRDGEAASDLVRQVYGLTAEGYTEGQIAQRLKQKPETVRLILSLKGEGHPDAPG